MPAQSDTAVRARSVVASAVSARLTTPAGQVDLLGGHTALPDGTLVVFVSPGGAVAGGLPDDGPGHARLLLVDLAPVAVRVRERARLELVGTVRRAGPDEAAEAWSLLSGESGGPEHALALRFSPEVVLLTEGRCATRVDLADFSCAAPDPVVPYEAALLHHLAAAHRDSVEVLARAVADADGDRAASDVGRAASDGDRAASDVGRAATAVVPLRLSSTALTLRFCDAAGHRDVDVPFLDPVTDPRHADRAIAALVHACHSGARIL